MKLIIYTQCQENYGTAEKPFWKMKGGDEYVVRNWEHGNALSAITRVTDKIDCDGPMYAEWVKHFEVVADDFLTDFEKSQLELEGAIIYSPREIAFE